MPPAEDTIFAVSSGAPPAAIAIMRVSGSMAATVLRRLAGRVPVPRRATVSALRDEAGQLLDRALLLWLPGPSTATGEDLAELHLHGGRAVIAAVGAALARIDGCRAAEPGEFTRRAFANGRLDLLEAEGLADLLASETEDERRRALHVAEGGISREIDRWRERLLGIAARTEALIEFGDDEEDVGADPMLGDEIASFARDLGTVLAMPPAERLRDGVRAVIAGPPNSGKSSLLNALAGREAAIATPIPGTTRDLIEVPVVLDGRAVLLIDSAGLRETDELVEREGIERAQRAIDGADIVLWLGPPTNRPARGRTIVVHAMADLAGREVMPGEAMLAVSVRTGVGLGELRALLVEQIGELLPAPAGLALLERQRQLVGECLDHVSVAAAMGDPVLRAEEIRLALASLDRLQGRAGVEDMLDALFGRFCIGK